MKGFEEAESDLAPRVSLRQVLSRVRFLRTDDLWVSEVITRPEEILPGGILFVVEDGLAAVDAVTHALSRGAAGVVTESLLPVPIAQCVVPDIGQAITKVSDSLAGRPGEQLITIGVIGTHGKLSTTLATAAVLRKNGLRCAYRCDLGSSDGLVHGGVVDSVVTGGDVVRWLEDAVDAKCAAGVIELDDRAILSGAAQPARFDILIVTGSCNDVVLLEAFDMVGPEGVLLVRSDDRRLVRMAEQSGHPMLTFGLDADADFSGSIFRREPGETTVMISAGDVTQSLRTKWTGPWMARHQLAATAVGQLLGASLETCCAALAELKPLPGRLQTVGRMDRARIVLDAANRADRVRTSLRTLRSEGQGRVWCVLDISESLEADELAAMARAAEKHADEVIVTSANSEGVSFMQAWHSAMDGIESPSRVRQCNSRRRALNEAMLRAAPNDTILVTRIVPEYNSLSERRVWDRERRLVERLQSKNADAEIGAEPLVLKHPALFG